MDSPSALHPSRDAHPDEQTPTTPTQGAPQPLPHQPPQDAQSDLSSPPDTPTRRGFGALRGQRALPDEPLTPPGRTDGGLQESSVSLKRASAYRESPSMALQAGKTHDVDMGEGDEDNIAEDDGSDNDSATSEGQPPSKKKKGQRFFCTEFPPCQLSFTRSEHLARHIRKHTGERPFQCHCSRRFSRLDNLRQHAQTVHVNEEIPGDSLAATSTRFQRQIRTDRVRPQSSRSRASTTGSSSGVHSRGHSRNLSNSSVGSTTSSMGMPEDTRRRPQPLAIANDSPPHGKLAIDTQTPSSPGQQYPYYAQSPTGYSTPTSTTFSGGAPSPRFSSGMGSPASTLSRSSFYNGARHGRRLSVPSASLTYQGGQGYPPPPPPPYFSPMQSNNSAMYSQNSSVFGSPTTTVFSHNRRESETELEYRRRTWHPGTNQGYTQRPATSGLSYHSTPDDHRPALSGQPAASQVTRLPGIESFDHAPPTSARQPNSPGVGEASPHPTSNHRHRPSDGGLHQNLTRLDIASANAPPAERQWQSASAQHPPQPLHFQHQAPTTIAPHQMQHHSMPEPPSTSRKNKRQAWYGGPVLPPSTSNIHASPHRPSPEDSGSSDGAPTPSASLAHEFHPVIVNPHGSSEPYPLGPVLADERKIGSSATQQHQPPSDQDPQSYAAAHPGAVQQHPPHPHHMLPHPHPQQYPQQYPSQQQQTYALQTGRDLQIATSHPPPQNHDMGRLEALVAVATSEGRAAERS